VGQFNDTYRIRNIAHVQTWSRQQINNISDVYDNSDIILTQPLLSDYFGKFQTQSLLEFNYKAKNIPIIIFPSVEFNGFFPFSIRIPIMPERIFAPEAQCGIVFWSFINGYDEDQAYAFCNDFYNDYSRADLYRSIYSVALARLEAIETTLGIQANISYLFRNKYTDEKLMHNRYHPANVVFAFIANRILSTLGIYHKVVAPQREFMIQDELPISQSIKNALGITFDDDNCFYNLGILQAMPDYISSVYSFYRQNPPTVESTIKMSEHKLRVIDNIIKHKYDDLDILALFHW
jgi:hypothetical protein